MTGEALAKEILATERLRVSLAAISMESVLRDLPALRQAEIEPEIEVRPEWNFVITCASLLSQVNLEQAQDAALRIAQGAMLSADTTQEQRAAASLLMERLGNRLGLELAAARQVDQSGVSQSTWEQAPAVLQLDVIKRRLELSIFVRGLGEVSGNRFQRDLWSSLEDAQWVSASAPTSAGKSFIVRRWFGQLASNSAEFLGVYLVPTRALIEEVSREIRKELGGDVAVYTIPWDKNIGSSPREIHVVTQERLHFLYEQYPVLAPDLLFIDEAQKFGDQQRGVLLQRVLADSVRRNPDLQVAFASPMAANPELLIEDGPENSRAIRSETVTVNQNLLWADSVPRKPQKWTASLVDDGKPIKAGEFVLPGRSIKDSKRLPLVAVALGRSSTGNVVYVNTARGAETTASQIADALGPEADISEREDIRALQELIEKTIHRSYALSQVLKRGVAFHYGNMPLLVRKEIEDLFHARVLRYLVCTSTLLEGVNLPCRNIFIRAPKKGSSPMSSADFWNLAGRAGRWGKEFEGNVICVDTQKRNVWADVPARRTRTPLSRASAPVLRDLGTLRAYVEADAPVEEIWNDGLQEDVYSFLASRILSGQTLADLPSVPVDEPAEVKALELAIVSGLERVELPSELIRRHAGISPPSMQRLLKYIREHPEQDAMLLALPEDDDAAVDYKRALARCDKQLGSNFGPSDKRLMQLAILIVNWMKGRPLAYLIAKRIEINSKRGNRNVARDIRNTMKDVDEVARFAAPRYLACYLDILKVHLDRTDRAGDAELLPDISMMLELGVARTTEVSMMAIGLSRATAIALEEFVSQDDLTPEECVDWLRQAGLDTLELPELVKREISETLGRSDPSRS